MHLWSLVGTFCCLNSNGWTVKQSLIWSLHQLYTDATSDTGRHMDDNKRYPPFRYYRIHTDLYKWVPSHRFNIMRSVWTSVLRERRQRIANVTSSPMASIDDSNGGDTTETSTMINGSNGTRKRGRDPSSTTRSPSILVAS
jgi:hypothetical protein